MYTLSSARKPKWQYPQGAPAPRILHLPRRPIARRKSATKTTPQKEWATKLETLFDQERSFHGRGIGRLSVGEAASSRWDRHEEERRRARVEEEREGEEVEENWRFQAEMLRAECNLLRMEKEIAVKKMDRRRRHMERSLRSVLHSLVSGKQRISEGQNASRILEEEISYLIEKLDELRKMSRSKVSETKNCSNFDRQASVLQRRLQGFHDLSDEMCVKEIQELAVASLSIKPSCHVEDSPLSSSNSNIDVLGSKMQTLSKGVLLETVEREYSPILREESHEETGVCSRHCRAVVRRIVEQVRAETEQWSQMQEMLGQVREEMGELRASRDFWEELALHSQHQIQFLGCAVQEWREKALCSEANANELQVQVNNLRGEIERLKKTPARNASMKLFEEESEMEKRVLICSLKENEKDTYRGLQQEKPLSKETRKAQAISTLAGPKVSPLQEIQNVSPFVKRRIKPGFPFGNVDKENKL